MARTAPAHTSGRTDDETPSVRRRTRMSPEAREAAILAAAIEFFAERGFAAQTRELAAQIGVSEPLIYRYFATKDILIQRVYEETILSRWDPEWETRLRDRTVAVRDRLIEFYGKYLEAIDDRVWIRIVMYSSLDGLHLTNDYIMVRVQHLLSVISDELVIALELDEKPEPEIMWHLQSSFIYYLVRKYIHETAVSGDRPHTVELLVDDFLGGLVRHIDVT